MNTTELKALAENAPKGRWDVGSYYIWRGDDRWHPVHVQKRGLMAETKTAAMSAWVAAANPAAILELIAHLEDAQGEIRALRATEAGLRERVKELESVLSQARDALAGGLWDYGPGQDEHEKCNEVIAFVDAALLEKKE